MPVSSWATVVLACGAAGLGRVSSVVTPVLVLERAGGSRSTASGMFAVSNQLGTFGGASMRGLMLALGGFPPGWFFLSGGAVIAATVIRFTLRDSTTALPQATPYQGKSATNAPSSGIGQTPRQLARRRSPTKPRSKTRRSYLWPSIRG